jgi:hypothetical protein
MRKQISIAVLLAFAAMAALGETAKLTEPKAGVYLALGTTVPISWNASGAAKIKLVLFRANVGKVGIIRSDLQLAAAFHFWKVGTLENNKAAPAGNDYRIRIVRMADNKVLDMGPTFSIIEPAQPSHLTLVVMDPNRNVASPPPFHTAQGSVKFNAVVYLVYDTNTWPLDWISIPGETNLCSGGIQSW